MKHKVFLKAGREKSLLQRHPWLFSGAVERVENDPGLGDTVLVCDKKGRILGAGGFSPKSQICVRMWSFGEHEDINQAFFYDKIKNAAELKSVLPELKDSDAYRVINAESDGLPGLTVDKYGDFLVCQFLAAGVEHWKKDIASALVDIFKPAGIYERSDVRIREKEGLPLISENLYGSLPPDDLYITENSMKFYVNLKTGHKTGFYLDQRDNRAYLRRFCDKKTVLNCFSYTGAFGIYAACNGASSVLNIDSSADVLGIAEKNADLNRVGAGKINNICGDVFDELRKFRDSNRKFDIIVLDPPKFAESQSQIERAARAYKDINLLAFKLLAPGGHLFTFSCSGLMKMDLFSKIVADAALDANRSVAVIKSLWQATDHYSALNFPEGLYLKGLHCVCR